MKILKAREEEKTEQRSMQRRPRLFLLREQEMKRDA